MRYKLMELGLKAQKKDIFKVYRKLLSSQYNSLEENKEKQMERLSNILTHSYKYVPYYREIFNNAGVINRGKVDFEKFNSIPILTKKIIRKNFQDLISKDPDFALRKPYINTSGGSTGEPVKFYQDRDVWVSTMATKWLFYSFITEYPCKLLKLWGSERDIIEGSMGLKSTIQNLLSNRIFLNSFKMSEEDMFSYVTKINRFKPEIIEAYVQSISELVDFIDSENLNIYKPVGVLTSAGTLYSEIEEKVKGAFNCKVYNRYGSREVGDIACSCSKSNALHINNLRLYVEILGEDLNPVKPGKLGGVYVTTLDNYSMPLIRYSIGDVAVQSEKEVCSCGRGFNLIESVKGRYMSIFRTREGDRVDGEYFVHLFYMKDWVKRFQVIQDQYDSIRLKIVQNNNYEINRKDVKEIESKIRLVMGDKCKIDWEYLKNIDSLDSGKYLYTISNVK